MRTLSRWVVATTIALAGLGIGATAASAAPAAQAATAPAVSSQALGGWFYYATYTNLNTCNYAGLILVANGYADGSTCYYRSGYYDLYLYTF